MDLNYTLRVDALAALTAESSAEQKAAYEKWERSNRISLMIMKGSITTAIRRAIPDSDNAKLYLAHIEEQFQGSSKAHAITLITKMVTLKYSGSNGVREHILRMNDMASQLKALAMEISEGATVHITNSLQGFLFVKKLNKGDRNVLVGNGEKAQVEAIRTLRLVLESGFNLDLVDTVYVPSMTKNLISVSRLDAYGYSFKFENKGFSLFLYSRVIGSGLLEGNLYKLLLNASFTESLKTMNVNDVVAKTCGKRKGENENSAKLWHERLGHISRGRMERLIKDGILHSLDFSDFDTCIECIKGKFVKGNKRGATRSTGLLKVIHTLMFMLL
ncbi:hypothetical protein RJ640_004128 [Escallonia rubra]|uniref:GAG-pre-integrase domain-containing protein n=1 Tax=Escallonia rubra TaxID=112253 RepID=A0AA88SGG6_9ASTE|nr:hypothetical protein RJ640_004128 [Escallonia rubra]